MKKAPQRQPAATSHQNLLGSLSRWITRPKGAHDTPVHVETTPIDKKTIPKIKNLYGGVKSELGMCNVLLPSSCMIPIR